MDPTEPVLTWTEQEFQRHVVAFARTHGWTVRVMDQRNARGVLRAQSRDQRGWPDLKCLRGTTALWVELKTVTGGTTELQIERISQLTAAGETVMVVDPRGWSALQEVLS